VSVQVKSQLEGEKADLEADLAAALDEQEVGPVPFAAVDAQPL
jgi:hypothetical protein